MNNLEIEKFIRENSPGGFLNHVVQDEFLQSDEWRGFQESVGRKTYYISSEGFSASIIEHQLLIVGNYFYIPRGPIASPSSKKFPISNFQNFFGEIIKLAEKENAGWIRIEPADDKLLNLIKKNTKHKITKASHDMQPKEILVMDITKPEEELLAEMKPKTRYNIKLSQKHYVFVRVISNFQFPIFKRNQNHQLPTTDYINEFIKLVKIAAQRDKITPHPESYYRKMFEAIPGDILKLYVAEYEGKIIAANIVIFFGKTATYLHGASDYKYRNSMAPYLLQWRAILDAKKMGCTRYDLGGIKTTNNQQLTTNNWSGITRFKTGFAPDTAPIIFPGSYDVVLDSFKYNLYRVLQKIKSLI